MQENKESDSGRGIREAERGTNKEEGKRRGVSVLLYFLSLRNSIPTYQRTCSQLGSYPPPNILFSKRFYTIC